MYIAVDFDGTIVFHEYPEIGEEVPFAISTLEALQDAGHDLILHTMRSGKELQDAVKFLELRGISLFGVNSNPTQSKWTSIPKSYANLYIDDAALGCPLLRTKEQPRPFVDWQEIQKLLKEQGVL